MSFSAGGSSFTPSYANPSPWTYSNIYHHRPPAVSQYFTVPGEGTSGSNMPRATVSICNLPMPLFASPPWIRAQRKSSPYSLPQDFIMRTGTSDGTVPQPIVSVHNLSMPLQPITSESLLSPWTEAAWQYDHQSLIALPGGTSDGNVPKTTVSIRNLPMPREPVTFMTPQWGGADLQYNRYSACSDQ